MKLFGPRYPEEIAKRVRLIGRHVHAPEEHPGDGDATSPPRVVRADRVGFLRRPAVVRVTLRRLGAAGGPIPIRLVHGEETLRVFELYGVEYDCPFKPDKVHDVLRSLGRAEIASILAEEGFVTIRNEMCNHEYRFDAAMIDAVFAS